VALVGCIGFAPFGVLLALVAVAAYVSPPFPNFGNPIGDLGGLVGSSPFGLIACRMPLDVERADVVVGHVIVEELLCEGTLIGFHMLSWTPSILLLDCLGVSASI